MISALFVDDSFRKCYGDKRERQSRTFDTPNIQEQTDRKARQDGRQSNQKTVQEVRLHHILEQINLGASPHKLRPPTPGSTKSPSTRIPSNAPA